MNKEERKSFLIKIFTINIIIPLIVGLIREVFVNYYNPSLKISVLEAFIKGVFNPPVILMIIAFGSIGVYITINILKPLLNCLNTNTLNNDARRCALKIPLSITLFHIIAWSIGTIIFYVIAKKEPTYKGLIYERVPLWWSLAFSIDIGIKTGLISSFFIGSILLPLKRKLNLTFIRKNELDFIYINRLFFIILSILFSCGLYFFYIIRYYLHVRKIDFNMTNVYLSIFIISLLHLIIYFVVIYISNKEEEYQIKEILKRIDDISNKRISFTEKISFIHFDKIGQLISNFNTLTEVFEKNIKFLKNKNEEIEDKTNKFIENANEMTESSNLQSIALKEILSTMNDSEKMIKHLNSELSNVHNIIEDSSKRITDGFSQINRLFDEINKIKESNNKTKKLIGDLFFQINHIWEIIEIINHIADQTKIIAFNAELEASAYIEKNKNFKIVATEIRKLVSNTTNSTSEIKKIIHDTETYSKTLIKSINDENLLIESNYNILQRIIEIYNNIIEESKQIKDFINNNQRLLNAQINSYAQIFTALKEVSEGLNQFCISTEYNSTLSKDLKNKLENFKEFLEAQGNASSN